MGNCEATQPIVTRVHLRMRYHEISRFGFAVFLIENQNRYNIEFSAATTTAFFHLEEYIQSKHWYAYNIADILQIDGMQY